MRLTKQKLKQLIVETIEENQSLKLKIRPDVFKKRFKRLVSTLREAYKDFDVKSYYRGPSSHPTALNYRIDMAQRVGGIYRDDESLLMIAHLYNENNEPIWRITGDWTGAPTQDIPYSQENLEDLLSVIKQFSEDLKNSEAQALASQRPAPEFSAAPEDGGDD